MGVEERTDMYKHLFKDVLKFREVKVHTDLSKADVIKVLDSLKENAIKFEESKRENDRLVVAIANIGFNMVSDYGPHKTIFDTHAKYKR